MSRWHPETVEERFWAKVDKSGDCWLWTAYIKPNGYGQFGIDAIRRGAYAHRVAWELTHGRIPDGMHLDHLCRVRSCVNPAHLEVVTPYVNAHRGIGYASRTHCIHGHEFTEANTWRRKNRPGRHCRTCRNAAAQRLRDRRRLEAAQ